MKHFTISEVAADWRGLMIPRRTMRPSIAHPSRYLGQDVTCLSPARRSLVATAVYGPPDTLFN